MSEELTTEELKAELERRKSSERGIGSRIASGLLKGASGGATDLLSAPVDIPAAVARLGGADIEGLAPQLKERLGTGVPDDPVERGAYNFAEGAAPSAAIGAVAGPAAAAAAGLVGGTLNMAGKAFFPESPTLQSLINMVPLFGNAVRQVGKSVMPKNKPGMVVDPETKTPMTAGQASGDVEQLSKEEAMRRNVATAPLAKQAYAAQDSHITSFFDNIQKTADKNPDVEALFPKVFKAFENKNDSLIESFKTANRRNFAAAETAGAGKPVIPTDNVLRKVDDLAAFYNNPEVPGMQQISSSWKRIKDAYLEETPAGAVLGPNGQPLIPKGVQQQKITVERLQQNLAAWADAAKTGSYTVPGRSGNMFEGVAPGQVKGFARQVLNAYKADMDQAINSGVAGAALLKKARDEFKTGLEGIENWAAHPVVKNMSVEQITALEPEKAVKMLSELPNSQRLVAASAIRAQDPQAWEQLRTVSFKNYMQDATDKKTGYLMPDKAYEVFSNIPKKDFDYLFPTAAEKSEAKAGIATLQKLASKKDFTQLSEEQLVQSLDEISSLTGAMYGAKGRYTTKLALDVARNIAGRPQTVEQAAFMAFNPDGRALARAALSGRMEWDKPTKNALDEYIKLSPFGRRVAVPVATSGLVTGREQPYDDTELMLLKQEAKKRGLQ